MYVRVHHIITISKEMFLDDAFCSVGNDHNAFLFGDQAWSANEKGLVWQNSKLEHPSLIEKILRCLVPGGRTIPNVRWWLKRGHLVSYLWAWQSVLYIIASVPSELGSKALHIPGQDKRKKPFSLSHAQKALTELVLLHTYIHRRNRPFPSWIGKVDQWFSWKLRWKPKDGVIGNLINN